MKKITFLATLLIAFLTLSATGVRAQLVTASPSQLSFASMVGTPVEQQTTIKLLGTGIYSLTGFSVAFTGTGADQFSAQVSNPSLTELLSGVPITVTFNPSATGSYQANMVVTVKVLGVLSLAATVPLAGMTFTTDPMPGDTVYVDSFDGVSSHGFTIPMSFADEVLLQESIGIDDEAGIFPCTLEEGVARNEIDITGYSNLPATANFNPIIAAGALSDRNGTPLNAISLNYVVDPHPYLISVSPSAGTVFYTNASDFTADFVFTFNNNISLAYYPVEISGAPSLTSSVDVNRNVLTVTVSGAIDTTQTFTLTIPNETVVDADYPLLAYKGGSWTYTVEPPSRRSATGSEDVVPDKAVTSEVYYTISGVPINATSLQRGQIYVKKITYEDGSVKAEKFVQQK